MPSLTKLSKPEAKESRTERLAVNLKDVLDRVLPEIRGPLLKDKVDLSKPIRMDPKDIEEVAIEFSCDLLSAGCILDTLRSHDRAAGDHPTRAYLKKSSVWVKQQGSVLFTKVAGNQVILNPDVFAPEVKPTELARPVPKAVRL